MKSRVSSTRSRKLQAPGRFSISEALIQFYNSKKTAKSVNNLPQIGSVVGKATRSACESPEAPRSPAKNCTRPKVVKVRSHQEDALASLLHTETQTHVADAILCAQKAVSPQRPRTAKTYSKISPMKAARRNYMTIKIDRNLQKDTNDDQQSPSPRGRKPPTGRKSTMSRRSSNGKQSSPKSPVKLEKVWDPYYILNLVSDGKGTPFADFFDWIFGSVPDYMMQYDRTLYRSRVNSFPKPMEKKVQEAVTPYWGAPRRYGACNWNKRIWNYKFVPESKDLELDPYFLDFKQSNKKVVIISLEGVIGDFYRKNLQQNQEKQFCIRPDTIRGLQLLQNEFQLVLISRQNDLVLMYIVDYLSQAGVNFDGIYKSKKFFQLDVLCADLINPEQTVENFIFVTGLNMEIYDIENSPMNQDILWWRQGIQNIIHLDFLPIISELYPNPPKVIAIPNFRQQPSKEIFSFFDIRAAVWFFTRAYYGGPSLKIHELESNQLQELYLEETLSNKDKSRCKLHGDVVGRKSVWKVLNKIAIVYRKEEYGELEQVTLKDLKNINEE